MEIHNDVYTIEPRFFIFLILNNRAIFFSKDHSWILHLKVYWLKLLNIATILAFMLFLPTFADNIAFSFRIAVATVIGIFLLMLMEHQ